MRLRTATIADIDLVLHHRREMFREMGYSDPEQLEKTQSVSREYLVDAIPRGLYHGLLAEDDGASIVGGGGVVIAPWPGVPESTHPRRAWILNIFVEPRHRRQGIARLLTTALAAWCRAQGFTSVSLHASEQGRPLYSQLGFKPTTEMRLPLDGAGACVAEPRATGCEWLWNEFSHAGTDYSDIEEVRRYDRRMRQVRDVDAENKAILAALEPEARHTIIEIGCGTGSFSIAAAERCRRVIAIDISAMMLEYAKAKADDAGLSNIEFRHAGFLTYEHEGEPADSVVSGLALHHLPDLWKSVALRRIAAMLKPGGRLLLMDVVFSLEGAPELYFPGLIASLPESMRKGLQDHIAKEYSTLDWIMRGLLDRTGFRIDSEESDNGWLRRYLCTRL